jgi:biopolymer transport protein ExbD
MISLTPLIDVVFILLLFFLLASRFGQWRAFTLDAAGASVASAPGESRPAVLLRVHPDGRHDLNGAPLDSARLVEVLQGYCQRDPNLVVVLQARADVELQALVTAMDAIAAAGIKEARLQ